MLKKKYCIKNYQYLAKNVIRLIVFEKRQIKEYRYNKDNV